MPDRYANVAHIQVTESAANTLTYKKLETGISLFEKMAWVISRIEYYWLAFALADANDGLTVGITTSNNPSSLVPEHVAVVDMTRFEMIYLGVPANALLLTAPVIRDFSELPGGGLIVPPNPIYLALEGLSQPAALVMDARIYYTAVQLKGYEFWELVESRRIISST